MTTSPAAAAAAAAPGPWPDPRWSPQALDAVQRALDAARPGDHAIFDADGTLWRDDIGEDFFRWQLEGARLPALAGHPDPWAHYASLCASDEPAGYAWLAQVLAGLEERLVEAWAADFFAREYAHRIHPGMPALVARLHAAGVNVWIVSGSVRWIVAAGAPAVGVPTTRVIGSRTVVRAGRVTADIDAPTPSGEGKVRCIERFIDRDARPLLVAGNSMGDFPMMRRARVCALAVNPAPRLQSEAEAAGWPIVRF